MQMRTSMYIIKTAMSAVEVLNKHQQKAEATRRRLIASARRIFAKTGFEAARIEDIAADAGHTRGAFYANFDSKETLFFALLEQQASENMFLLTERLQSCETDRERIAALRGYYLERASDRQWAMLSLEFKLFAVRHPRLRAKLARTHNQIRASMKAQIDALFNGGPQIGSQASTRAALEAVLSGLVLQHAYDPDTLTENDLTQSLGRIFDVLTHQPDCD